ncbi:MAG TPA: hypothetical protein VFV72_01995 [Candidatus Limnocylindrales bacterium]|nr:hypothetical protein [Candidatus Limnocylindrales bacterium]
MRRLVTSIGLALAIGLVPLASAAAHECYVVHRSANGNEGASGSGQWVTITLTDIYEETELFGFPDLTPAQVDYAVAAAGASGIPASFTIRSDKLLFENAGGWQKGDHATDGNGVDHFFAAFGEPLVGILFEALANA